MLTANEIRDRFLNYFKTNGHEVVTSSSLIPRDDPSLLFTNAGMVQFKKVFQGQERLGFSRATTAQKCLRVGGKHNDLENVGRTARHHTFFEMLGNFSFGDYFKAEAIKLAWGFLTEVMGLEKSRLYATVYLDDDEASELWQNVIGLPPERIFRLGDKDNFWSMGDVGPCGPCSEIIYDQGSHMSCGTNCGIGQCDCDRFLEIWNLVFMQYNQDETGRREPLPRPSIDTGMGLERLTAVHQGVYSNFETDLFRPLIDLAGQLAGVSYQKDRDTDTALQVIADHSRAMAFMIADGILPSNDGRGYVLRRLIRRAFRFGRMIGLTEPFLYRTAGEVVAQMGRAYPELTDNQAFMARVITQEEERFSQTLDKGLAILNEEIELLRQKGLKTISGATAFKLYDTYGFPLDIVNDVTGRQGLSVDEDAFRTLMLEQKERAKAAWKGSGEIDLAGRFQALLAEGIFSEFSGYDEIRGLSRIVALLDSRAGQTETLLAGDSGYVVFSRTPFYGESGGQAGDQGGMSTATGQAQVTDCLKPAADLIVQAITVTAGRILLDQEAEIIVHDELRLATARNHTCTHLLHAALRKILGEHVKQAGSLVSSDRLRFDFTHIAPLSKEELAKVEREVNLAILADQKLRTTVMDYPEAVQKGAMALFGEKYADQVRVVEVPGWSIELCGGTHLTSTGQAGSFVLLSESGVAAGVRRIEAATGLNALEIYNSRRAILADLTEVFRCKPEDMPERARGLMTEAKQLRKEAGRREAQAVQHQGDIMAGLTTVKEVPFLAVTLENMNVKALRELMDDVRSKMPSGVAVLASVEDGRVNMIVYVSRNLHERFTAPDLIKEPAALIGGKGGGRPDLAQAGGNRPGAMPEALDRLRQLLG